MTRACYRWTTLIALSIASYVSVNGNNCTVEVCPKNLPYCSPVGCLFECPNGSFIDGYFCRTNCREKYIDQNKCVDTCPDTAHFIQTKTELINWTFKKLRYCRRACTSETYVVNGTCVQSCPDGNKFVENNTCTSQCKKNMLRVNVTKHDQLTAIKCVPSCDKGRFIQNGYCVGSCLQNQVIYQDTCQDHCPMNATIRDTDNAGNIFCKLSCDDQSRILVENGSCVKQCSKGLLIANNRCVQDCPEELPLKYVEFTGITHCWQSCVPGAILQENGFCVSQCQESRNVYQNKCIVECPDEAPIVYDGHCESYTSCTRNRRNLVYNKTCVENCPNGSNFVYNWECREKCPQEAPFCCKVDYNECEISILEYPFVANGFKCLDKCPPNWKHFKNSCVKTCPDQTFLHGNNCLENCPKSTPFMFENSCVSNCSLADKRKIYNNTCVKSCPNGTFIQDDLCVENCSSKTPYIIGDTCVNYPVQKCKPGELIDDDKCIKRSDCEKVIVFDGTCSNSCPVGYIYTRVKDKPCLSRKIVLFNLICYGIDGIFLVILLIAFFSMKRFTLCKVFKLKKGSQMSSSDGNIGDNEPLLSEDNVDVIVV